jgi:mRNA-degrading endonuclease toxin of MazEF toxin-antitoxin module
LKGLGTNTCLILPITTSKQIHNFRFDIGSVTGQDSKVILSQMKVIDTKRFINKIAVLDIERFEIIRKAVKDFL